jgi:hypothetical protein
LGMDNLVDLATENTESFEFFSQRTL